MVFGTAADPIVAVHREPAYASRPVIDHTVVAVQQVVHTVAKLPVVHIVVGTELVARTAATELHIAAAHTPASAVAIA